MHGIVKFLILIILFFTVNAFANKALYQCTSDDYDYEGQQMVLHLMEQKQPQVYFFRNLNDQAVWINRPLLHPSASAGWTSQLAPGHWSALFINQGPAVFDCAIMKSSYQLESVACQDVLSICRLSQVTIKKGKQDTEGAYWLAEDIKNEQKLLEQLKKRGIRWKK